MTTRPALRLKHAVTFQAGNTPSTDDERLWADEGGIPWVAIGDMTGQPVVTATAKNISASGLSAARLRVGEPGTVLLAMYASVGQTATLGVPAVWNQAILGLSPLPGRADPRFLGYWLESIKADWSALFRSNTQDNLNAEVVGNAPFPDLSIEAQRATADYLDAETSRIDALIELRRRHLTLLDARLEAVVWQFSVGGHHVGQTRDSGLSWAPRMPSHWATPPVGANFQVQLGKMLNPEAKMAGEPSPYLRNVNVQWDRVDLLDLEEMHFDAADRVRYSLREGDLLVCEGGEVGRAAVWHEEMPGCYYQKALHRVRPYGADSTRFLMYSLMAAAGRGVFENEGNTSTFVHLTAEKLRAHRFPWPPVSEQHWIVRALDQEKEASVAAVDAISRQIDLLTVRRQSLITAAVTGQIEIPGVDA
jgi:type I restriction enzyme S subunit